MRLLLDSHTLIWSVDQPAQISPTAMTAMSDPANDLIVSTATIWEIAIKFGLGRLPLSLPYRQWMDKAMAARGWCCCRSRWTTLSGKPVCRGITVTRSIACSWLKSRSKACRS
jgi:hypothetical protein